MKCKASKVFKSLIHYMEKLNTSDFKLEYNEPGSTSFEVSLSLEGSLSPRQLTDIFANKSREISEGQFEAS